jgi:cytidylate kinase
MPTLTISGLPGSGTTTISKLLERDLHLPRIYTGMFFRRLSKKYKMNLAEFSKYCESDSSIDHQIDKKQIDLLKKGNLIIESRVGGWLAYKNNIQAYKIWLEAGLKVRAGRVAKRENKSMAESIRQISEREESEKRRYKTYYRIDLADLSIYDLVIDTKDKSPEEIEALILRKLHV